MAQSPVIQFSLQELQQAFPATRREQLRRVLDRCRADLEHPLLSIGTGCHITIKRATALEMALDGADPATIAPAVSLSEARVRQVLANVQAFGMEALYPRFEETLLMAKPLDEKALWKKSILPDLKSAPQGKGIPGEKWRPSTVTDYLVQSGAVEDASISQISAIIARFKDKRSKVSIEIGGGSLDLSGELQFTFAEPETTSHKRIAPFELSWGFMFAMALLFLWIFSSYPSTNMSPLMRWGGGLFMGLGAIVIFLTLVKQTLEWWLLQRVLAATPGANPDSLTASALLKTWVRRDILGRPVNGKVAVRSARSILVKWLQNNVPFMKPKRTAAASDVVQGTNPINPMSAPPLKILHSESLPSTPWEIGNMTDARNALGEPPIRTLYLWVFEAQGSQKICETQGWPQLGPVHMLLNATALPLKQLVHASKNLLLRDPESVDREIATYTDSAGTYARPTLFEQLGVLKGTTYEGYPIHTPVCTDGSWEHALHTLAKRCDLAVVNLSGYDPTHPGLEYEIHHLLSGGPPRQFFFIYDYGTDADAVIESVLDVWSRLTNPPASAPTLLFLRTGNAENDEYEAQFRSRRETKTAMKKYFGEKAAGYVPVAGRAAAYVRQSASVNLGSANVEVRPQTTV